MVQKHNFVSPTFCSLFDVREQRPIINLIHARGAVKKCYPGLVSAVEQNNMSLHNPLCL